MSERSHHKNTERVGILLAVIAGVSLFFNGLRFAVFGLLLATIWRSAGLVLLIAGLAVGSAVFVGLLVYWKYKDFGLSFILIASLWGLLVSGSSYFGPILGVISALVLLYVNAPSIDRNRAVALVIIGLLSLLPLLGMLRSQSEGYQYLTVDGLQRQYLIHVPESYDGSDPVPLLVALHGGGGDARSMKRSYGFDAASEKFGFIVIYPDGTGDLQYSLHTWNSGYIDAYASRNSIDDVKFIHGLILHIIDEYEVNASAVYMTGHSNGAMMTYRFGAEHPEMLAGIAPVSGSVGGRETPDSDLYVIPGPDYPLSVVHVHGKLDEQVLYEGGTGKKGFLADRVDLSVSQSVTFWVENNNCSSVPSVELSANERIEIWRYSGGLEDTEVLMVTLHHGDHSWLNMSSEVASEAFYGTSLAEMIWRLFASL